MKTTITTCCASFLLAAATLLKAGETPKPQTNSPDFERMKTLVGTWTGKTDMGQGPVEMTVRFRVVAGGSVLEERVFEGTPNEMVTMYFEENGKLALTHYCMLGNRPAMKLKSSDAKTISFDFDGACCTIDAKKEAHMHALQLSFDDADTITSRCTALIDGKPAPTHPVTLKRVKAVAVE